MAGGRLLTGLMRSRNQKKRNSQLIGAMMLHNVRRKAAIVGCFFVASYLRIQDASGFAPIFATTTASTAAATKDVLINAFVEPKAKVQETKRVVTKVAVAGATGRTGRLVVEELLARGVQRVVAVVRDTEKASQVFPNPPSNLEIVQCNLGDEGQIANVLQGVDAAIWCATGFSDAADVDWLEKLKRLLGFAVAAEKSIDVVGLPAFARSIVQKKALRDSKFPLPTIVMCSSAGVTRTIWSKGKKEKFRGAADIPIVRLNPLGILDLKRKSEEKLRECRADYCIVRACGLNDKWPADSRPVLTQGDVAVGRLNRRDLARVLVDVLSYPEATGKTFEVVGVAGYPQPLSLGPALSRLYKDSDPRASSEDAVFATYTAMQQLLPGVQQDAAALAMGQTYEQLDKGATGRLGKRGREDVTQIEQDLTRT